jgi:hypothetical protein
MAKSGWERQKKWKVNQTSAGKKAVTVMLDAEIKKLIDKERKRSGENIASIIEKAVVNLLNPSQKNLTSEKHSHTSNGIENQIKSHPNRKEILTLVGKFHNSGTNPSTIATILTTQNYETLSGNDKWTGDDVKDILDIGVNNRSLYHDIVYRIE